ncbi:hypothetical protein O6H91_11G030500 [Diphasiastrum complanatum]|uniref:Uncharacterized protein n=5 Tax=Diphasiastrum complanatum TaxID=34168 RepID=A0ACC2C7H9_DIPCM|nr:hypothetical protein O6H91_11G030500 [Diphasiastrum complanatum]KAJ7537980.1 hypothetical protein O6H91_11G030500 [Diphasiastrum complanatum]KAJ7537983.1 hypothetical protein O6H91_11G030500 [Diphasiastrum complanatum]KAJ7537989.1 hypothetical protein O6H91_11G030500 [Diphasiastrum complanatum]KAJ7537996.1 hypothetical protein O6H91_11G030500 [Diphasiastrum complanatum]
MEVVAGDKKVQNTTLWLECAGPLVTLPVVGSYVAYFPQGHSEQVAASTQKEADMQFPSYPNLPPQLICQLYNITLHADQETDEVYAQMTLQPVTGVSCQEKDQSLMSNLGIQTKEPTISFSKILTASDTSTHGGFSIPRRAADKVFPPLDYTKQPPAQEIVARDLHNNEWHFRHIFRGQPRRHLLTTGWSIFVSSKRLQAGDTVLFMRDQNGHLLLGIRCAKRQQTAIPSSLLSSDSMFIGVLAAAAHAAATNSRFTIFYNPRASPSEFVIPLVKYNKAVFHTQISVGMRFRMELETEDSSTRRYIGTITGIGDLDPIRWPNSYWRSLKVGWDESTAGQRQRRVSLWEIEPLSSPFIVCHSSSLLLRSKRPRLPQGLGQTLSSEEVLESPMKQSSLWGRGEEGTTDIQNLNLQGLGLERSMQIHQRSDLMALTLPSDYYRSLDTFQEIRYEKSSQAIQHSSPSLIQLQEVHSGTQQLQPQQNGLAPTNTSVPSLQPSNALPVSLKAPFTNADVTVSSISCSSLFALPEVGSRKSSGVMHKDDTRCLSVLQPIQSSMQQHIHEVSGPGLISKDSQVSDVWLSSVREGNSLHNQSDLSSIMLGWDASLFPGGPFALPGGDVANKAGGVTLPVRHDPLFFRESAEVQDLMHSDPRSHLLFGVNIDNSPGLRGTDAPSVSDAMNESNDAQNGFVAKNSLPGPSCSSSGPDVQMPSSMLLKEQTNECALLQPPTWPQLQPAPTRTFTKVYKLGSVGRSLDMSRFRNYEELRHELAKMFNLQEQLEDSQRSGWQLVFVDNENDVLLVGDDPWEEFVNCVRFIKILSPSEVLQMNEEGMEWLSRVPIQNQSSSNSEDCFGHRDSHNQSSMNISTGSFDH